MEWRCSTFKKKITLGKLVGVSSMDIKLLDGNQWILQKKKKKKMVISESFDIA